MKTLLAPAKGRWADFSSTGHPLAWYHALRAAGYQGVFLDIMSSGWPVDYQYALEAGLDILFNQGYYAAAWSDPKAAVSRAQYAAAQLRVVNADPGVTLFLDCEAMAITDIAAIDWLNAWDRECDALGHHSLGKYEGPNCPLTGAQWYGSLPLTQHYWRSKSLVPTIPTRGYQLVQTGIQDLFDGIAIDEDTAGADQKGTHAMAIHNPNGPSIASRSASTTVHQQITALQAQVTAIQQQMHQAASALQK